MMDEFNEEINEKKLFKIKEINELLLMKNNLTLQ